MIITSMGIFGFLSRAHIEQSAPIGDSVAQIEIIDERIAIEQEVIEQYRRDLTILNQQIERFSELGAVTRGVNARAAQQEERQAIFDRIEQSQQTITDLRQQRAPFAADVRKIETESPMPDLEETSQDIASDLKMDTVKVEEIMWYCIEQGLFEQDEFTGRLCAHKVYKFLQQSETRSTFLRMMFADYKSKKDVILGLSQTNVKNRKEKNMGDKKRFKKPTESEVKEYAESIGYYLTPSRFIDYYESTGWMIGKKKMRDWKAAVRTWKRRDDDSAPKDDIAAQVAKTNAAVDKLGRRE
jgi:hypothetical protein